MRFLSAPADLFVLLHGVCLIFIHAMQALIVELKVCLVKVRQILRKIGIGVEVARIHRLYRSRNPSRPNIGRERPQVGIIRTHIVNDSNFLCHRNNSCRTSFLMWKDDCRNLS